MTIVLCDFSQMVISSVAANVEDVKNDPKNLIKHIALNQLLALKKRFGGKLILCCDSRGDYWRKKEFQYYKGHRKHHKDDTGMDWELVYETLNELKVELAENFPYIVLEVPGAEADDLIAVLVKHFDENELSNTGLIDEPQEVVIASTDGDFQQLQKYRNVQQWNNVQKKMIKCKNPKQYLIEHICTGDAGDNIPNIVTGDWWARDRADDVSTRAKGFKQARLEDFYKKGIDACVDEEERRNFKRNERLVDFDFIPFELSDRILSIYTRYEVKGSNARIFNYLMAHRMKLLMSSAQDF